MLENVIEDKEFALLMKKNIQELVIHFFEKEQNFGILCKIEEAEFVCLALNTSYVQFFVEKIREELKLLEGKNRG